MAQDFTQEQLEEMVQGKQPEPRAVFFEKAALNVTNSHAAGHRMYDKVVYIKRTQPGVEDWVAHRAQQADIEAYPQEYEHFMNNRQGLRTPSVEIIPGLDITHLQELIDYGLATIPQLAAANTVPPHLEYARLSAVNINRVLQEASHGYQEEIPSEEIEGHGTGVQAHTPDVPAPDRRQHANRVPRHQLPPGNGGQEGEAAQGIQAGGRVNGRFPVVSPNFELGTK